MLEAWRAKDEDIDAIAAARQRRSVRGARAASDRRGLGDPRLRRPTRSRVRALTPRGRADRRTAAPQGRFLRSLDPARPSRAPDLPARGRRAPDGVESYDDPYAFGPALGPLDDYLLVEGTHRELYRRLGAQIAVHEGVDGVLFAVWAPNAVARLGGRRFQPVGRPRAARCASASTAGCGRSSSRTSAPARSTNTKSSRPTASLQPLKADPFGFEAEMRPSTASVVARTADFSWTDADYLERRDATAKRGAGRCRSSRSISAPGGAARTGAS